MRRSYNFSNSRYYDSTPADLHSGERSTDRTLAAAERLAESEAGGDMESLSLPQFGMLRRRRRRSQAG